MKLNRADVIIVLGRGIRPDGTIPKITQYRAEKAAELYKNNFAPWIIISAGYWGFQRFTPPNTEAIPMKAIAVKKGVPQSNIILEQDSRDTLGNAFFTRLIVDRRRWKKLIVVTSKDHFLRTKYYFDKIYGLNYNIQYSLARSSLSKYELDKISIFERFSLRLASLDDINAGDLQAAREYIYNKHIMYNGSKLKEFISLFVRQPYNK